MSRSAMSLTLAVCTLLTAAASAADEKTVYQPAGAPADPKVSVAWNRYHDYAESTAMMKSMVAAHPNRAKLRSLGKSYAGREMWLLTITNFERGSDVERGSDRDKPAFWIGSAIHANEIQGTEVALYTAWYLLEMYGRNPLITRLVDERTFYVVPMMSPDSRDAHMFRPNTTSSPRSGQLPVDDDRDGLTNEDGPDDLDGDGHITQMRVRDPNGRYRPDETYPHLMVRAEADRPGGYRLLGSEGYDNDDDGRINEDGDGYYDPNRDWPWNWQPKHIQGGAYHYPLSLPENRLVADFVMDHPNIAGAQHYHNAGGMILRGPGAKEDRFDAADVAVLDAIGHRGETILPGYRYISIGEDLYQVYGGECDFYYMMQGIFCFTNELFTPRQFFRREADDDSADPREDREQFDKFLLFGDGSVPWREVDHPQYGKIEVGGFKKTWGRQPPSFLLEEECHRNMAFTLYHADQLPQVEIQSLATKPGPGGLTEVTAAIVNRRLTPTHTAIDVKHELTLPDLVSITGKNVDVVLGLQSESPFFEKATEQPRHPETLRVATVGGMSAVYVRWLVRGKGPITVRVQSPKGGNARQQATIP